MRELTITADCGGSNGARVRLWKVELQKLADESGLTLKVHHYPPGTSKWNRIEHRMFCHITQNWRGQPLESRMAVVELIGEYKNGGSDYRASGCPDAVNVHDFVDKTLGKVVPYGVYDIGANAGWVSLGITSDTAEFAVNAILTWIERVGPARYPAMRELTITADCGGSNGRASGCGKWSCKRSPTRAG